MVLYLGGMFFWSWFLNYGNIAPFHDWVEVNLPRLAIVQNALHEGYFPFFSAASGPLRGITHRFLCIPDIILSPDIFLLKWLRMDQFILYHWLFSYTLGFLPLIWLRLKRKTHPALILIFFTLINFNGHILGHLTVGHYTWGGYFFIPWVILLCQEVHEVKNRWVWISLTASLLFLMWLLGSFQQYLVCLIVLGLYGLPSGSQRKNIWSAGVFSVLLSMCRILPPVLILSNADHESLGGFRFIHHAIQSMLLPMPAKKWLPFENFNSNLGWWEFNHFMGISGCLLLSAAGIFWAVKQWKSKKASALFLPVLVISVLSIRHIYSFFFSWVPMFNGVRVSARFLIFPILITAFAALPDIRQWLESLTAGKKRLAHILLWFIAIIFLAELLSQAIGWDVRTMATVFPILPYDPAQQLPRQGNDPVYFALAGCGYLISLLTTVFLSVKILKTETKSASLRQDPQL